MSSIRKKRGARDVNTTTGQGRGKAASNTRQGSLPAGGAAHGPRNAHLATAAGAGAGAGAAAAGWGWARAGSSAGLSSSKMKYMQPMEGATCGTASGCRRRWMRPVGREQGSRQRARTGAAGTGAAAAAARGRRRGARPSSACTASLATAVPGTPHLEVGGQGSRVEAGQALGAQHLADAVQGAAVQDGAPRQALFGVAGRRGVGGSGREARVFPRRAQPAACQPHDISRGRKQRSITKSTVGGLACSTRLPSPSQPSPAQPAPGPAGGGAPPPAAASASAPPPRSTCRSRRAGAAAALRRRSGPGRCCGRRAEWQGAGGRAGGVGMWDGVG